MTDTNDLRVLGLTVSQLRMAVAIADKWEPQWREAALAARSDITQAATGGPDFTPKEWPEPRAEGLREVQCFERLPDATDPHTGKPIPRWRPLAATPPAEGLDVRNE